MIKIGILTHDFEKTNLVTICRGGKCYDTVKCTRCGLEGKRYGLSDMITVRADKECRSIVQGKVGVTSERVKITSKDLDFNFGFKQNKIYDRVPCPIDQMDKYGEYVWIFSDKRGEPVRLIPGEFILVK